MDKTAQFQTAKQALRGMIYFILILALVSPDAIHAQSQTHQGTLTLKGNEELTIDGTEYHQKGNIVLHDNARITIKNGGTLFFDQDSDRQYFITLDGKSQFSIDSGNLTSAFAHVVTLSGLSRVNLNQAVAGDKDFKKPGTVWQTNGGQTVFEAKDSILESFLLKYPSQHDDAANATVHIAGGRMRVLQFNFNLKSHATFNGLSERQNINLDLPGKTTNLPYSLKLENAFVNSIQIYNGGKSNVVLNKSKISEIRPSTTSKTKIVDSEVSKLTLKMTNIYGDVVIDGLKSGQMKSWTLDMQRNGNILFEVQNSTIKSTYLQPSNVHLTIKNSEIKSLRPARDTRLIVQDSHMGDMQFVSFTGKVYFDNTVVDKLTVVSSVPKRANSFEMKGSVAFCSADPNVFGVNWGVSRIVRLFPITVLKDGKNAPDIPWQLSRSDHSLIHFDKTGKQGEILVTAIFDDTNYKDPLYLKVNKSIEIPIWLWSNSPIIVDLDKGIDQKDTACQPASAKPTKAPTPSAGTTPTP